MSIRRLFGHGSVVACVLLAPVVGAGCGSSRPTSPGGTGGQAGATSSSSGEGGSTPVTSGGGSGSTSSNSTSTTTGSSSGSTSGSSSSSSGGSSSTSSSSSGSSSSSSGTTSDYPFCNYGSVPSGTPPAAWVDNPTLTPTGVNPYGAPKTTIPGGYLLLSEGPNGTTEVPQATQTATLARLNSDLKFITEYSYIHLPPWSTGVTGTHYIDYILVGTGLPQDPQSAGDSSWEGQYPDVETTSVAMTDTTQRWDLTHEFNHVLQNSYGTILGTNVAWIQESYNDFLIMRLAENVGGATPGQTAQFALPDNVAYLDTLVYQQPYVPIESCGINGSSAMVNGPEDYFTDTTAYRYNDLFPLFVSQRVGQYFFAAVWEKAKTTEQVLQTMTRLLDETRVECMVQEYSARLALGDFMELSTSVQQRSDPGMYTATTNQGGWLVPSTTNTLPRYTGRNNIPITVASGATQVSVDFAPDATGSSGTTADMRAQIVYRATDGTSVFSAPVATGSTSITLTKAPKHGVVVVVVTNVTMGGYKTAKSYGWDPNETFGYKVQVTGGSPAPTNVTYF